MSTQAKTSNVENILNTTEATKSAIHALTEKIDALCLKVNELASKTQIEDALVQTQFEEIKEHLSQISKAQTGTKKQIKPVVDKPTETSAATEIKTPNAKKSVETKNQFFERMILESAEFRAKYDSDLVKQHHVPKTRSKTPSLQAIMSDSALAKVKADFEAEFKADKNKPSDKVEQVKDDEL